MSIRNHLSLLAIAFIAAPIHAQSSVDLREAARKTTGAIVEVPAKEIDDDLMRRYVDLTGMPKPGEGIEQKWSYAIAARNLVTKADGDSPRSAFCVRDNLVIGWKIDEDQPTLQVGGKEMKGKVVVRDHVTNLVAIEVEIESLKPLSFSPQQPQAGMPILVTWWDDDVVVHQAGMIATDRNSVSAQLGYSHRVDLRSRDGILGAPVVDTGGALLGVLVQSDGKLIMLPTDSVERLIVAASADEPADLKRGRIGIQLVEDKGASVAQIMPDTPAADAGIQAGDRIKSINGQQVDSHRDVIAMVATARGGDEITVEYERDGETAEKTLKLGIVEPSKPTAIAGTQIYGAPNQPLWRLENGNLVPLGHDLTIEATKGIESVLGAKELLLTGDLHVERSKMEESIRKLEKEKAEQQEMIQKLRDRISEMEARAKEQAQKNEQADVERIEAIIEEIKKKMQDR